MNRIILPPRLLRGVADGAPLIGPGSLADPLRDRPDVALFATDPLAVLWVESDVPDIRGKSLEQWRMIRIASLVLRELTPDARLQPEKRSYLPGYTARARAGVLPPAIDVIATEGGKLIVADGHRRSLAAHAATCPALPLDQSHASMLASVSPMVWSPADNALVPMTKEGAMAAASWAAAQPGAAEEAAQAFAASHNAANAHAEPPGWLDFMCDAAQQLEAGYYFEEGGCIAMAMALQKALHRDGCATQLSRKPSVNHLFVRGAHWTADHQGWGMLDQDAASRLITLSHSECRGLAHQWGITDSLEGDVEWAASIIECARGLAKAHRHVAAPRVSAR